MTKLDVTTYVAGHRGMVGSALVRALNAAGCQNLVLRTSSELDLRDQAAVREFMMETRPEHVYLAAAKVGGIHANNTYKADFLYDNLMMEANIIEAAREAGVNKLLFLGSSCIYPKHAAQPMTEDALLTGALEPTNEPYAIAKIAGLKLCDAYRDQHGCNFISAMPTNLYGPGDNYHPQNSHVLPALVRRFHEAKTSGAPEVVCWGTGSPMREFLHVDDLAQACLHLMVHHDQPGWVNVGTGTDVTIKELAELIASVVGYEGSIVWDTTQPDGTPRKLLDVSKINGLGWKASTTLEDGVRAVYADFQRALQEEELRS
jgi:GDP-L-fucose synthase